MRKTTILVEMERLRLPRVGLKADIKEAHRTYKIAQHDDHSQVCRLAETTVVNQCGMQGVASAAYWFWRFVAIIARVINLTGIRG